MTEVNISPQGFAAWRRVLGPYSTVHGRPSDGTYVMRLGTVLLVTTDLIPV